MLYCDPPVAMETQRIITSGLFLASWLHDAPLFLPHEALITTEAPGGTTKDGEGKKTQITPHSGLFKRFSR